MARKNVPLRISPELYASLERWAADEMRSVNAQIEFLLSQSVKKAGRGSTQSQPTQSQPTQSLPPASDAPEGQAAEGQAAEGRAAE
ncbi:hypothetical protein [Deinococcus sp.]|uniref:hypothetical protein n=1 Tax=Deinococcus sp. TaxID=47478 RepID=UPI0025D6ACED|nr:hypothetical protein [Deinococcus sp.]